MKHIALTIVGATMFFVGLFGLFWVTSHTSADTWWAAPAVFTAGLAVVLGVVLFITSAVEIGE